ncbi:MFS transporter [Lapidilactobacillus wuchangensis]|uniref:MFS transporter n=1 Tax=Lapidilactobacillus wuchangensis TaxID=2486001 RepID=UPI0013DE2569|nr:MFS transporter [Lapidilactobacillus wuchangensis]
MIINQHDTNIQIFKAVSSSLISGISGNMFSYGLGLMLLATTGSAISFGLSMVITPVVDLLVLVPIGNLVDHGTHKKLILSGMLGRLLALALLMTVIDRFSGQQKLIPVSIFLVVNAVCVNLYTTAQNSAIHELVNAEQIQRLSSLNNSASSLAAIISPTLGVALYSWLGFDAFLVCELVASLISLIITAAMKFQVSSNTEQIQHQQHFQQLQNFKMGLAYLKQRPLILKLISISVYLNFIFSALNIGLPFIVIKQLHLGNAAIGYLDTFNAIGMLTGSLLLSWRPQQKHLHQQIIGPVIMLTSLLGLLGLVLRQTTSLSQVLTLGGSLLFILGFSLAILNVTSQVRIQTTVPSHLLGRVSATMTTANTAIFPLGTLFFTACFQNFPSGALILALTGGIGLLISLMILPSLRHDLIQDQQKFDH